MSSTARLAMDAIITRLQAITTGNGYNTNAGNQVYAGLRGFQDDEDFPLISVFSGDELVEKLTFNSWRAERTVIIECYVKDKTAPTNSLELLIEDIQQALEQPDETLGGLVELLDYSGISIIDPPDPGSEISALVVTYYFSYQRVYGA